MSNSERYESIKQLVMMVEPQFNELARIHGAVNFAREASFALQALKSNDYLAQVAAGDQDSLKRAIINVAAIGLTLSPVHKLAYLVPRDRRVCLDISYRGYVQLGVDVGAIKWAVAEIVCAKDVFRLRGLGQEPLHEREPFGDRGAIVGGYCVAKTHDQDYLVTTMTIEEIYSIRGRSSSWRAYEKDRSKTNPWVTDELEMIKKTVIKRGSKSWPMTDTRRRFDQAVDVTTDADPMDFAALPAPEKASHRAEAFAQVRALLKDLDRTEEKYLEHLIRVFRRDLKSIEDMTEQETQQAITILNQFVVNKKAKEIPSENAG